MKLILGTSAIGGRNWGGSDPRSDLEAIQTSMDQGVTTIDTAPIYGMGQCEELVGQALQGRRHHIKVASKCGLRWDLRKCLSPARIAYECEQSLKRLKTDYIDLYQIHWPDDSTPLEESWQAMAKLKKQGKVRAIGVCNYTLEQLQVIQAIHPVDTVQLPYSLIRRDIEEEIVPFCLKHSIAVLIYSPLEKGLLTGKITLERQFSENDQRFSMFSIENRKKILKALQKLQPISGNHTLAQVVLSALIHKPWITGVITGARNHKQAIENAQSQKILLTDAEVHQIETTFKEINYEY